MKDDDVQGLVFKTTFHATIDFKEWAKHPITRKEALKEAWQHACFGDFHGVRRWLKAAWRGYWTGTIYNAGV